MLVSKVEPGYPNWPPFLRFDFLRKDCVRRMALAASDSCEGGTLLLWLSLSGSSYLDKRFFSIWISLSFWLMIRWRRLISAPYSHIVCSIEEILRFISDSIFDMSVTCSFIECKSTILGVIMKGDWYKVIRYISTSMRAWMPFAVLREIYLSSY